MKRIESNVKMIKRCTFEGTTNTYRLIRTNDKYYSLFLTTVFESETDEEFCPSFTADESKALKVFEMLCNGGVTACTLNDTVHDLMAEENE